MLLPKRVFKTRFFFCRYFAKVCFTCGYLWSTLALPLLSLRMWAVALRLCLRLFLCSLYRPLSLFCLVSFFCLLLSSLYCSFSLIKLVLLPLSLRMWAAAFGLIGFQLWSKLALPHLSLRMWAVALCFFVLFFRLLSFLLAFFLCFSLIPHFLFLASLLLYFLFLSFSLSLSFFLFLSFLSLFFLSFSFILCFSLSLVSFSVFFL